MTSERSVLDSFRQRLWLIGFAAAAAIGGRSVAMSPRTAILIAALPAVGVSLMFPAIPAVAGTAVLAYPRSITDGLGGLQIAASDVLLALSFAGVTIMLLSGRAVDLQPLKPLLVPLTVYLAALTVTFLHDPSLDGVITIAQRVELVIVALIIGAYLASTRHLDRALLCFVIGASVLAMAATLFALLRGAEAEGFLGVQKNPAGQAIANALLIVIFTRSIPLRPAFSVVLIVGLLSAQSRGAILATLIAVSFAAALATSGRRVRVIATIPLLLGIAYAAFSALPAAQQSRLLSLTPGADYAAEARVNYAGDAIDLFQSSPLLGTGVGQYAAGSFSAGTFTDDPHNVLLLELAEGGVVLGAGFIVLVATSVWVLVRRRSSHPIVVAALAVQVSIVIHGVVDVYWVRGTPVMGWLLIGAALWAAAQKPEEQEVDDADTVTQPTRIRSLPSTMLSRR